MKELEIYRRNAEEAYKVIERTKQEYKVLEEEYRSLLESNNKLKEVARKAEEEAQMLKSINFECSLRLKQMDEEKKRAEEISKRAVEEKDGLVEKFNSYGDQLQKSNAETLEAILIKHKDKQLKFKKKLAEQKELIGKREEEILRQKQMIQGMKEAYDKTITELHEDMKRVKDEWAHKIYDQDIEFQRRLAEEQSRNSLQISQLNEEYQQALELKLIELQQNAQTQIDKTKMTQMEMQKILEEKTKNLERDYIPIKDHEGEVRVLKEELSRLKEEYEKLECTYKEKVASLEIGRAHV
jgi:hypothetical protein